MALKVKAREKLLKFSKDSAGEYRYVMAPELYSALTQSKVIREAALRSGVSEGVMKACWDAAGEVIKAWATEGHSVALPGLGNHSYGQAESFRQDRSGGRSRRGHHTRRGRHIHDHPDQQRRGIRHLA